MLANVRGGSEDSPDLKGGIQKLRDLILIHLEKEFLNSDAEGRTPHTPSKRTETLFAKLKNKFYCKKVGQKIYGSNDESTRILDGLTDAIYKENKIEIVRYKGETRSNWKLSPLTLLTYNEAFYVIAREENQKIILLAIDRISAMKPLAKEHFKYPEDYSPAQYLDGGFGVGDVHDKRQEIKLLFHPEVTYLIRERLWHFSQEISEAPGPFPGGGLMLHMQVPDSFELRKFVLSFGSKVKVLAPESLDQFVKKERAIDLYE
jgi:predicted DNA-binding transcriptional regulator YafY